MNRIMDYAEVKEMILSEYDEELHLKDAYNCGYADGQESLSRLVTVLIKEKRMNDRKNPPF